jgi:hypothetical protein
MVVDRTFPILHGVPMHGAVSMDVTHDVRFRWAPIWQATGRMTVVRTGLAIHRVRRRPDFGRLQGKLQHRGDHHDDDAPTEPRLGADAQPHTSKSLHKARSPLNRPEAALR